MDNINIMLIIICVLLAFCTYFLWDISAAVHQYLKNQAGNIKQYPGVRRS